MFFVTSISVINKPIARTPPLLYVQSGLSQRLKVQVLVSAVIEPCIPCREFEGSCCFDRTNAVICGIMSQYFAYFMGSEATLSHSNGRRWGLHDSATAHTSRPARFKIFTCLLRDFISIKWHVRVIRCRRLFISLQ